MNDFIANIDGDDYELHGKYRPYRTILLRTRMDPDTPEEVKLRRAESLKTDLIPFWYRCQELREKESEELMAVFMKYNGPEGIRSRYSKELDDIKARLTDADDAVLLQCMACFHGEPVSLSGKKTFYYDPQGSISYNFALESEVDAPRAVVATKKPVINLVPLGGIDGVPHHHNMNPDDDPSHKVLLLNVLHRLMEEKDGKPFLNQVEDDKLAVYLATIGRPRYLEFIEKGLRSEDSIGYGSTAFFNDMLLLFRGYRLYHGPFSEYSMCALNLEILMKKLLRDMGGVGERLLAQYEAIVDQGSEDWPDPELIYLFPGHNPFLPYYEGEPDLGTVKIEAREQFKKGQARVQHLRSLLAKGASGTGQGADQPSVESEAPRDPLSQDEAPHGRGSQKRPRDQEDDDVVEIDPEHFPKRQRSHRSPAPRLTNSSRSPRRRAAAKRLRPAAQDGAAADDAEAVAGQGTSASKAASHSDAPGSSSGATSSGSGAVGPLHAAQKRGREPTDDGSEDDGVEAGEGRGPAGSKRLRLRDSTPPAHIFAAHPEAAPSTPKRAAPDGDDVEEPGSAQSHATSPATEPSPRPAVFPKSYPVPASKFLKFSRNSINMSKIAKMGKRRPWLFGFKTTEGFGIYAFASCPRGNCKHHFSTHPLRESRAYDHIFGCDQPIRDQRHMVKDYAVQVIKDEGRKSDLTVDWARKSNLNLLPAKLKDNHPENFPLAPPDEDDDEYAEEDVPE